MGSLPIDGIPSLPARSQRLQCSKSQHCQCPLVQAFVQCQPSPTPPTLTHTPTMNLWPCNHGHTKPHYQGTLLSLQCYRTQPPSFLSSHCNLSLGLLLRPQTRRPVGQTQHEDWFSESHKMLAHTVIKNNNVFPISLKGRTFHNFTFLLEKNMDCGITRLGVLAVQPLTEAE